MFSLFGNADDTLVGGGIVGGVMTAIGALYVIYDKVATRREKTRKENLVIQKQEIEVRQIARKAAEEEWSELFEARKKAHEEDAKRLAKAHKDDVERLERSLKDATIKIGELDGRERECQITLASIRQQNSHQQSQINDLRERKDDLKEEVRQLRHAVRNFGIKVPEGNSSNPSGIHEALPPPSPSDSSLDWDPNDPPKDKP